MYLSKRVLYIGIIAYSSALLIFQDWGMMSATVGAVSAAWLAKMLFDVGLAVTADIRRAGPFDDAKANDDVAIHSEDLAFSDIALFGVFLLNVAGNTGWHAYETVMTTGAVSFYFSLWVMAEAVILFLTWILFAHARKAQLRAARGLARAKAAGTVPLNRAAS